MLKGLIFTLALAVSSVGVAATSIVELVSGIAQQQLMDQVKTQALNWKVGDTNNYDLNIGGFLPGKMVMLCREIVADGIWLDQNVDLGFAGKQVASILIDPNTGETKKFLVNGKEQAIPKNNMEVVSVTEEKVTVPAGTFDSLHAVIKNKDDGSVSNAWLNPELIPLSGALKMVQPSQMGEVTIVLTSFKKN